MARSPRAGDQRRPSADAESRSLSPTFSVPDFLLSSSRLPQRPRSADLALFADPRLFGAAFCAAPVSVPPQGSGPFRAAVRRRHDCRRSRHECPRHKAKTLGLIGFVFTHRRCKHDLSWVVSSLFLCARGGRVFGGCGAIVEAGDVKLGGLGRSRAVAACGQVRRGVMDRRMVGRGERI